MFHSRAIQAWASKTKNLMGPETLRLIRQAEHDLYYGPMGGRGIGDEDNGYPGFSTACKQIAAELSFVVPSTLYVDDCEDYSTEEPEGSYVEVDSRSLVRAIVGKELAGYVS